MAFNVHSCPESSRLMLMTFINVHFILYRVAHVLELAGVVFPVQDVPEVQGLEFYLEGRRVLVLRRLALKTSKKCCVFRGQQVCWCLTRSKQSQRRRKQTYCFPSRGASYDPGAAAQSRKTCSQLSSSGSASALLSFCNSSSTSPPTPNVGWGSLFFFFFFIRTPHVQLIKYNVKSITIRKLC